MAAMEHTPIRNMALITLSAFAVVSLYRRIIRTLEVRYCRKQPPSLSEGLLDGSTSPQLSWRAVLLVLVDYYTVFYILCMCIIWVELKSAYNVLSQADFLDPPRLRAIFSEEEAPLPPWWEDELKHMLGGGPLRGFSLVSPVFLLLTLLVTLSNTCRHVWRLCHRGGHLVGNPGVDSTVIIVALPLIECLMAFRGVTRMWMICANSTAGSLGYVRDFDGQKTWVARLVLNQNMWKANFAISEIYASWALLHFASLTLACMSAQNARRSRSFLGEGDTRFRKGLENLTYQGLYLFNVVCVLEGVFYLGQTLIEAFNHTGMLRSLDVQIYMVHEKVHMFFLGMGTIASTAAIGNVVTVEVTFEELLEEFRPALKFWSTKILLSIAFVQSLLCYVPPLSSLSVTEWELFYASALCVECFAVSLLHYKAWVPGERWYDTLREHLMDPAEDS